MMKKVLVNGKWYDVYLDHGEKVSFYTDDGVETLEKAQVDDIKEVSSSEAQFDVRGNEMKAKTNTALPNRS